jgi:starch phosphorylase
MSQAKSSLQDSIFKHLTYSLAKRWEESNGRDKFRALALAVRDRLVERMLTTQSKYQREDSKRVYYLSIEFLIGRSLANNLQNLGIFEVCREALEEMGLELDQILEQENDAALGNGGLGRLAACFLDSLATLGLPGFGYGIHYEYGLFRQEIDNGYQREKPDNWLSAAGLIGIERDDEAYIVPVYGHIEHEKDLEGNYNPMWMDWKMIIGVPHDIPIVGYGGQTVNYLRLFEARPSTEFDIQIFNEGDYFRAMEQKINSETISKILYPSDLMEPGRELRLLQEYFMVACALKDIVRRFLQAHRNLRDFGDKVAIQLNDTHPALAVAELMRILVDEQDLPWEQAWTVTQQTLAYTNHTLLPEALEKWPVSLLERLLPRHLQIIHEINRRFLEQVAAIWPQESARWPRMSLIKTGTEPQVRMAHLAIVGCHSVNGVSALHTELLENSLFADFAALWPQKFNNKTNGITQRRWLLTANPLLAGLLTRTIGAGWITESSGLRDLEAFADESAFQEEFRAIKRVNKERLQKLIFETTRIEVSPDTLFDIQAKRIHEYKRQLLKVMHIIYEYLALVEDGRVPLVPKTYIFAGKAAPGYWAAKQIIKLIHNVGRVINHDPRAQDLLKVVFIPDYKVSLAEKIIPAADLSEQISTAGREASGTGNMKFALNGALTMGTLDGANVEMLAEVGAANIYIFGLKVEEIAAQRRAGAYHPWEYYHRQPEIRRVLDTFKSDLFCHGESGLFHWIFQKLLDQGDEYFHLADFLPYLEAQERAGKEYQSPALWTRKAVLNVARMGKFSSDRTIYEYARDIWGLEI